GARRVRRGHGLIPLMMRVALIEDHLITRDLLRRVCEDEFGFTVVFECDRGALALNAVTARGVDLAILDLALPDRDGLVVIDDLRRAKAEMRLLVLSSRF